MNSQPPRPVYPTFIRRNYSFGLLFLFIVMVIGSIIWAIYYPIEIRVVAPGELIGDKEVIEVRAQESGLVKHLAVSNNERVKKGQILVSLDDSDLQDESRQLQVKLKAMRCEAKNLREENRILTQKQSDIFKAIEQENIIDVESLFAPQKLCESAASSYRIRFLSREISLRIEKMLIARQTLSDLDNSIRLLTEQIASLSEDVRSKRGLAAQKHVSPFQLRQVERDLARQTLSLEETRNQKRSHERRISELKKEAETELARHQKMLAQEMVEKEQRVMDDQLRLSAVNARIRQMVVHSPTDGIVLDVNSYVASNFVQRAEMLMTIFPRQSMNIIRAKLALEDIDNILPEEQVQIRFFTHKDLRDKLVSATIKVINPLATTPSREQTEHAGYYEVILRIDDKEFDYSSAEIKAGIIVEVLFSAEKTTLARAILRPIERNWPKLFEQ